MIKLMVTVCSLILILGWSNHSTATPKNPTEKSSEKSDKSKKKKSKKEKKKKEDPGEGWKIDKIEVPADYKPSEEDLEKTKFWNYLDGPEVKDNVILKNGQVLKQLGYNLQFVDAIAQDKDKKAAPLYLFKSSPCRGSCGGGLFYVLHYPPRNDYFEFPLPKAGYVHEDGELEKDVSKHLWTKSVAYYGDCGSYKGSILIYRQERECDKCPLLHELRIGRVKAKAFQVEMQREQGPGTPKSFAKIIETLVRDVKKKTCKELPTL